MDRMRIGIVSATGTARKRTIPALDGSEICTVTAIHGRDGSRLGEVARRHGVRHQYTDLSSFIADRKFDVAMVCSPPFLHNDHVSALLTAGIPCLVEKPFALNVADAVSLRNLSIAKSTPVRIAHQLRHQNTFGTIKDSLTDGASDARSLHPSSGVSLLVGNPRVQGGSWILARMARLHFTMQGHIASIWRSACLVPA